MKVFISYSHDAEAHRQWVLDLGNQLRRDGIDAWIDRYFPAPLEGWPRWMQARIEEADLVLVVCTAVYCRRFEGREDPGIGRGATFEGLLVSQTLYEASMRNEKFIPLLPDGEPEVSIPLMLRPYPSYRYPSQYQGLQARIAGRPEFEPPPLGGAAEPREAPEPLEIPTSLFEGAPASGVIRYRVLTVDDRPSWRRLLREVLEELGPETIVDGAESFPAAESLVGQQRYDLAVVDRALLGEPSAEKQPDDLGIDLLEVIRRSPLNRNCAVIVLTGHPHAVHLFRRAYRDYGAYDVLTKKDFDGKAFLRTARAAVLDARLSAKDQRLRFTVSFDQERLYKSSLTGPKEDVYRADRPFDGNRFAESLDAIVETGADKGQIGLALYDSVFTSDERLFEPLTADEVLSKPSQDTVLRWSGPPVGLGVPFELLAEGDGREPWCLRHVLTRHLDLVDHASDKTATFANVVERLQEKKEILRILLIASGWESAEAFDREVAELKASIESELEEIALPHTVSVLSSSKATLTILRRVIRDGRPHILHYAGPGRRGDDLPAGVALRQDFVTAEALARLVENSDLYLAVFNGCPGLHGTGRFGGLFEALVRADVPAVLGHRWTVSDETSLLLATVFYRELWRTFSPGDALLAARRACATAGGDDEAWGSPVLVLQNA